MPFGVCLFSILKKKKSIWAFKRASKKAGVLTLAALFAAGFFCVHTCMFSV
jgi:hypothetical protein